MRKLILALVSLPVVALASPENPTRDELLQTVRHIQSLAQETQAELDAEKAAHSGIQAALSQAIKSNNETRDQFVSYQRATETEIKKGNDAITSLAALVKKHHLDLMILCSLWIGFVALLYLKAGAILGPWGVYIATGLGIAGSAFILWRL